MKKFLVLFGAAILVMALGSPSMAQFSSWGHMEIQTIWERYPDFNMGGSFFRKTTGTPSTPDADLTWRHIAQRYRFYLQYGDPKTVRAVIGFEADSTDWGELSGSGTTTGGKMGTYAADQVQLEVKHAYLDFVIPNTPLTLTAGIQLFTYGGRLFMNNDAPGVKLTANFAPHQIQGFWWRENDENRFTYHVNDTWGLEWRMAQKIFDIYAWTAYKNDLYTGNAGVAPASQFGNQPWWVGVGGGFRPGNWDFSGQFVYVLGKQDFYQETATLVDKDYKAFAVELAAKYRIGPGMFVGLEGFYSTGNDADKTDEINRYPVATASEGRSIFGNDRTVFMWMNAAQIGYYHDRDIDFSGMWYGRVNFEYSPTAWLRFNLNYLYIGDTSTGTDGLAGINSPLGSRTDKDEDFIGHELNLITSINIYKGFVYHIGLYYFVPGEVFDSPTKDADASYGINTKLVYAF
jgi:hypothetical protein